MPQDLGMPASEPPSAAGPPAAETPSVDEFIARAVDRQIAEQRAMRETLTRLQETVADLQSRPAPAAENTGVIEELRDMRESILPGLQRALDAMHGVRVIEKDLTSLRESVTSLSADMEGIAQALIDLNAGLRDWADGVDRKVTDVRLAADQIRALAERSNDLVERANAPDVDDAREAQRAELDRRVKESVELTIYIADQVESFDEIIAKMGDLPTKLEGVVGQALRRTLAARAKLDREAETALDEVLATLDEHVDSMSNTVSGLTESEDAIRKLTLGQVDLASRVESFHATLLDRLDDVEEGRKRAENALADAIDRAAQGKDPRAANTLAKVSSRKAKSRAKTQASPKPKPAKSSKPAAKKKPAARSAAKRRRQQKSEPPPLDHIPLN